MWNTPPILQWRSLHSSKWGCCVMSTCSSILRWIFPWKKRLWNLLSESFQSRQWSRTLTLFPSFYCRTWWPITLFNFPRILTFSTLSVKVLQVFNTSHRQQWRAWKGCGLNVEICYPALVWCGSVALQLPPNLKISLSWEFRRVAAFYFNYTCLWPST